MKFSDELEKWAESRGSKTLGGLIQKISRNSFALLMLMLMAIPALPLPTGGITHIFEIVNALLAVELMAGRKTVWLPKRWQKLSLASIAKGRGFAKFISIIKWFEGLSRPRAPQVVESKATQPVIGVFVLVFTVAAFLAPPFTGLDTLPSLGVVMMSLAMIFSDMFLLIAGCIVGSAGIGLIIALGSAAFRLF